MITTTFELALVVFISNISATMICEGIEMLVESYENYKEKKKLTKQKSKECNAECI